MKTFITAIPLFNADMSVEAYRLCTRDGYKLFGSMEDHRDMGQAMLSPALDLLATVGVEPFAGDKPLFAEFNQYLLLMDKPLEIKVPADKLVCILPQDTSIDNAIVEKCQSLKQLGYAFAFIDCPNQPADHPLLPLADYLMLDYRSEKFAANLKALTPFLRGKRLVIGNVPDTETFDKLKTVGHVLLTGDFFSSPITKNISEISPLKINLLHLLNEINQDDFDLTTIASTIERDPSLSISLLRFINSAAVGLPSRVTSIRNAVPILGQKEVRRWAFVATSVKLAEDRPGEITKLSLVRAKFAENLAGAFELGMFAPGLFLSGLFSLLDVILQKPMLLAIDEVAVEERVRLALVEKTGPYYEVMDLIYAYEHADWDRVSVNMIRNNVALEKINEAFVDALIWYKELLTAMDEEE